MLKHKISAEEYCAIPETLRDAYSPDGLGGYVVDLIYAEADDPAKLKHELDQVRAKLREAQAALEPSGMSKGKFGAELGMESGAAQKNDQKGHMINFPLFFPDEAPQWPRLLLQLTVLAAVGIVGSRAILIYLDPITALDTKAALQDRLTSHSHHVIRSHPTKKDVTMFTEGNPDGIRTPLPESANPASAPLPVASSPTLMPKPIIDHPVSTPPPAVITSDRYYMLSPPFLHGAPDTSAPFYRWKHIGQFRSAANCERFRQQAISDSADDRDQDGAEFKPLYDSRIKVLRAASCISAHDPRRRKWAPNDS